MKRRKDTVEFNKYVITILLGIIVFLNTSFLQALGDNIDQVTSYGINGLSAILFFSTLLLFYASAPKVHLVFKVYMCTTKTEKQNLKNWLKISNSIDYYVSVAVWYTLFTFLVISSVSALFRVF